MKPKTFENGKCEDVALLQIMVCVVTLYWCWMESVASINNDCNPVVLSRFWWGGGWAIAVSHVLLGCISSMGHT